MKRLSLLICLLYMAPIAYCQNLIPNGSFEQYDRCPSHYRDYAGFIRDWYSLNWGTPDYYNTCNTDPDSNIPDNYLGYEYPADGNAYVGILGAALTQNYAEYIAIGLQPLYPGMVYEVSMSVSLGDSVSAATDGLGVTFTKGRDTVKHWGKAPHKAKVSFQNYGVLKNSVGWTRISGTFVADKAYDNIVIGNFADNAKLEVVKSTILQVCYYYIDSVVMVPVPWRPVPPMSVGLSASKVCAGDSLYVSLDIKNNDSFNIGNVFTIELLDDTGHVSARFLHDAHASGKLGSKLPAGLRLGTYKVRVITSAPPDTFLLDEKVTVDSAPSIKLIAGFPRCDEDIQLRLESNKPVQAYWYGPNEFYAEGQEAAINEAGNRHSGVYTAVAKVGACTVKDTIGIRLDCRYVQVPSAFTPNGDGKNDVLYIYGTENVTEMSFQVFDRWGRVVYQSTDPHAGWDGSYNGEKTDPETFAYVLHAVQKDGSTQHQRGNITLVR